MCDRMRHLAIVVAAFTTLSFAGTGSAIAGYRGPHGCHWGDANNCQFSTYRQCMQSNIWALLLDFCTPPPTHGKHSTH
jgi:hypothetical protein